MTGMPKKKISILVIGFQKEDQRMYPHLYDFLQSIKDLYDEVIYFPDDDRGEGLFIIEHYVRSFREVIRGLFGMGREMAATLVDGGGNPRRITPGLFFYLAKKLGCLVARQVSLIEKLKRISFRNEGRVILAIDHTAAFFATKYVPEVPVALWSFDILTEDAPWRLKDGWLERLITSRTALTPDILMTQDEARKDLFEQSVGKEYGELLYLPVSLSDSEFCRAESERRASIRMLDRTEIVQCGWLAPNRYTDRLVEAFQAWPPNYDLHLHGPMHGDRVVRMIDAATRKPHLSSDFLDHEALTRFLGRFDIGFVGYGETDLNHSFIENASAQLVGFLRLGMPVIVHQPTRLNDFVKEHRIGIGVEDMAGITEAIGGITANYSFFAANARYLFERKFNLDTLLEKEILPRLNDIAIGRGGSQ